MRIHMPPQRDSHVPAEALVDGGLAGVRPDRRHDTGPGSIVAGTEPARRGKRGEAAKAPDLMPKSAAAAGEGASYPS